MRGNIALPVVLAAVFTVGCILIQQLERHTEDVEDALTSTFLIVAALAMTALLTRYADSAHALQRSSPKQVQSAEAPRPPPKLGLMGIIWQLPRFRQSCC
jgi:hypothetical protein